MRKLIAAAAFLVAAVVSADAAASGTVWNPSGGTAEAYAPSLGPWDNQTLRQPIEMSAGGTQIRIRLTDAYSAQAAWIGHVTVGTQLTAGTTQGTPVTATFNGSQSVTIPAGGDVQSDPIQFPVTPNTRVLVSIYLPTGAQLSQAPRHDFADATSYNYVGGDVSATQVMPVTNTFNFYTLVSGVDVAGAAPTGVVVAGDSIADGLGSATDTDTRWPNYLADRAASQGISVLNAGIGGNEVTADQGASGLSLQNRLARDVLSQPGVRTVIDSDGTNDLRHGVSAATLEQAQTAIRQQVQARGMQFVLTTITPCLGESLCTAAVDAQRHAYNTWVLTQSGVPSIDFDRVLSLNDALNPAYDSGDHLHPSQAGYRAMADFVDLSIL